MAATAIPVGLCQCGCGQATSVAKKTDANSGRVKGQPMRFVFGHNNNRPIEVRFWEKVDKTDGCWLWTGAADGEGYGVLVTNRRKQSAHRVSWELEHGAPPTLDVLHTCDTPRCVRPDHLFLGTQADNNLDMVSKARQRGTPGETHPMAKLAASEVAEIRAAHVSRAPRDGTVRRRREALAQRFGISVAHVIAIQLGTVWKGSAA